MQSFGDVIDDTTTTEPPIEYDYLNWNYEERDLQMYDILQDTTFQRTADNERSRPKKSGCLI